MPVDAPEDLYGLPLEEFIAERSALVKSLRAEKRREEAGEVAALRKPSVAAWAVNQLVRTQPQTIRALFDAGDALAQAQRQAASGEHTGDAMREATRRQRDALGELTEAAEGLLGSQGSALSQATLERVTDTLRAAAIDDEARREVQTGCLTHELRFAGLGLSGLEASPAPQPPSAPSRRKPSGRAPGTAAKAPKTALADAERRRRETRLAAARQDEADARRAAARAEKELTAAQSRREEAAAHLDEAQRQLADAEDLLGAAERRAEQTAAELQAAEQTARDLTRS